MNHEDHKNLLRNGIAERSGPPAWADLGSGTGAFTLALADLLGPGATVYSVDRDSRSLREQERAMQSRFPHTTVHYQSVDFTRRLELPLLDGIVMANSLHFVAEKPPVLSLVRSYLKPSGRLILVEYNTDHGNTWVPYPLSFGTWEKLAKQNGFEQTRLIATVPSRFLGAIYAALSM